MKSRLDIERAIKERGKTYRAVCAAAGVAYTNFRQVLDGNPTIKTLYKIADAIGCDIIDLFYPVDNQDDTDNKMGTEVAHINDHANVGPSPVAPEAPIEAESTSPSQEPKVIFCPHCGTKFQVLS